MSESKRGKLVIISGPSGVGKSTLAKAVVRRTGAVLSVSATTRPPRSGEVDGREYFFVDRPAFEKMIERGELLEWAELFGGLYGTPAPAVSKAVAEGCTILLEIDVQGGMQVHEKMSDATFILIVPPGEGVLHQRLAGRGSESEQSLRARLGKAREELRLARESNVYDYEVVNDDLEQAVRQVVDIVKTKQEQGLI